MKRFVVYDPGSGKILRSGVCQDGNIDRQARPGEAAMEGQGDDLLHEVDLESKAVVMRPLPLPPPTPKPEPPAAPPPSDEEIDAAKSIGDIKLLLKRVAKSR